MNDKLDWYTRQSLCDVVRSENYSEGKMLNHNTVFSSNFHKKKKWKGDTLCNA